MLTFNRLIQTFDDFIFESFKIKTEYLGLYRILYCLSIFLIYDIPNFTWIGGNLDYLFMPPPFSIANMFTGFPDKLFFTSLSIIIVILYLMLLFGWQTKKVSLLLFFSLLLGYNFSFSFGKIDHNILWLIIPLIMAFSGWGNAFSLDATCNNKSEANAWAISLLALLIGFAMFTAGVPKLIGGWLSFNSLAAKSHLINNYLFYGRKPLLLDEVLKIKNAFLWELADYLIVIFEFGFFIALIYPLAFRFFVIAAVFFHITVFLTFDISFTNNLLAYLIFINWSIFAPLVKSSLFKHLVEKVFKFKYLVIAVGSVLIYGFITVIFDLDFILPSLLHLILEMLHANTRDLNTFLIFFIALIVTLLNILVYCRKQAKAFFYEVKTNT